MKFRLHGFVNKWRKYSMQPSASSTNVLLETPLTLKIYQASRTVPRVWQWRLFFISLVINDVIMLGIAFRLAYYARFELSIPVFQLEANPSFSFYQFEAQGSGHVRTGNRPEGTHRQMFHQCSGTPRRPRSPSSGSGSQNWPSMSATYRQPRYRSKSRGQYHRHSHPHRHRLSARRTG